MRRDWSCEPPCLGKNPLHGDSSKAGYCLAVGLFAEAGLDRVPIAAAARIRQRRRKDRLSNPCVSARDYDSEAHGCPAAITVASRSNTWDTVGASTLSVTA